MSMNAIQFQRGLSLPQFQALYGREEQCERALVAARWPHGWQCAHCGCKRFFLTRNGIGRQLWECFICGYQSSSIVGTVMEHTHLPLRLWFMAMYLLTQHKNAIQAPVGCVLQDSMAAQTQADAGHGPARCALSAERACGDR